MRPLHHTTRMTRAPQSADPGEARPLRQDDFDSGFSMIRKLALQGLIVALIALVAICVVEPNAIPFAIAGGLLLIAFFVGGMAKLRVRMDAAKQEIASRGGRPLMPGDFSDEDDWR